MTKFTERRNRHRPIRKNIVIFYHANCTDGFSAAWAAWKRFGDKAEYWSTFHDDPLPKGLKNKEIYTLDLTFPLPVTRKLIKENKRVTAIDHHVTSKKTTEMTYKHSYALHHSGATLAWKYFHPGKKVPKFLLSVEDMDIWTLKIPGTRELFAYLDLFDFDFATYSRLVRDFENEQKRQKIFEIGKTIDRHTNRLIDREINKNLRIVRLAGRKVYAINASSVFRSELGHKLAEANPEKIGLVWWEKSDGAINASLRSIGTADVAKLAEKFGGGGHKHSSSFRLKSIKDIPWKPEI